MISLGRPAPGDFSSYVDVKQESFAYPYAPSHGQPAQYQHVGDSSRRRSSFESQNPGLGYPPATTTASAASYAATMPQKRPSEGDNSTPSKHIKAEHPEEFSNAVKKKLQSSNRTGQACDRCKIRKIRCDALLGGCSPCLQNNTACRTTDRITGRATSRGYVEGLEQQNRDFQHRIKELETRLMQSGGDIRPANGYHDGGASFDYQQPAAPAPAWNAANSYPPQNTSHGLPTSLPETNMFKALPTVRTGTCGSNFLGVSSGNSNLSAIKGTALTILGMEIDIANFDSYDMDEPRNSVFVPQLYNKSYQAFLQSALNINPRIPVETVNLPPRDEGLRTAEYYFRVLNPYLPLLHRPTFINLLTEIYDDPTFQPTTAQTVMVHMVFAIMFFQNSVRNQHDKAERDRLNAMSNNHYHYSLSMFFQLSCSHTVQDVQALTLICAHLRNFPKPGASWILTQTTMSLAIELGLHLSSSRWVGVSEPNHLDIEMRKRTFWAILMIHVTLSGKLGRPISIRSEDFDVEIPEPIDDELLSEAGVDTSRPGVCRHEIGLQAMRIIPLFMELYNTIYAVRRYPETYISTVNSLESKIRAWKDNLPPNLVRGELGESHLEGRVFALYAEMWVLEFRLLLRHPSVEMTDDKAFKAESMRACLECSREMLERVTELQAFNSLDTTWYNTAVYVMAITTTLFATYAKEKTSAADITTLRSDMDRWLSIMGDQGRLLGSGDALKEAVRAVIEGTMGMLDKRIHGNSNAYIQSNNHTEESKTHFQRSSSTSTYANTVSNYNFENSPQTNGSSSSAAYPTTAQTDHQQTPYPAATQYSTYSEPSTIAYTPHETSHAYTTYPATTDEAPLLASFALQASQAQANGTWQRSSISASGAQSWQQWTNTVAGHLEPQDCYSASALMQLGGRDLADGSVAANGTVQTSMGDVNNMQANVEIDQAQLAGQINNGMSMVWPQGFDVVSSGTGT